MTEVQTAVCFVLLMIVSVGNFWAIFLFIDKRSSTAFRISFFGGVILPFCAGWLAFLMSFFAGAWLLGWVELSS